MNELERCPICGSKPESYKRKHIGDFIVFCWKDDHVVQVSGETLIDAKYKWNEYAILKGVAGDRKGVCEMLPLEPKIGVYGCYCSNCGIRIPGLAGSDFNYCPECGLKVVHYV